MTGRPNPRLRRSISLPMLLISGVLFAPMFSPHVRADETKFTLGPGILTFTELAQQLSTNGRRVQCPVNLKNHAAWVFLKQRTWAQMRNLLGAGLDVEFAPNAKKENKENLWTMRRDPSALRREQNFLDRYEANLIESAHWRADALLNGFVLADSPAFAPMRQRFDELNKENMAILRNKNATKEDIQRRQALMKTMGAMPAAFPENWVLALLLSRELNLTAIDAAIRSGPGIQAVDRNLLPQDVLIGLYVLNIRGAAPLDALNAVTRPWQDVIAQTRLPDDFTLWTGLRYNPLNLGIEFMSGVSVNGVTCALPSSITGGSYYTPEPVFQADARGVPHPWPGLGKEANAWLDARRAATRAFLQTEMARKPFLPKSARPLSSVSQIVEQWSRVLDGEAVMELLPTREPLAQYGSDMGHKDDVEQPESGRACRLDKLFSDEDAWQFEQKDGALLVKDVFAFTDRLRQYPLEAFVKLERNCDSRSGEAGKAAAPGWQDMLAYAREAAPGQSAAWQWMESYRGINSDTLTHLPPLLHLIGRLPRSQQEYILTDLCRQAEAEANRLQPDQNRAGAGPEQSVLEANKSTVEKPIADKNADNLPPAARNPLARRLAVRDWDYLLAEYRALPDPFPNWAWNPNALSILQSCTLRMVVAPRYRNAANVLWLYLDYPDPASTWANTLRLGTQAIVGESAADPPK